MLFVLLRSMLMLGFARGCALLPNTLSAMTTGDSTSLKRMQSGALRCTV